MYALPVRPQGASDVSDSEGTGTSQATAAERAEAERREHTKKWWCLRVKVSARDRPEGQEEGGEEALGVPRLVDGSRYRNRRRLARSGVWTVLRLAPDAVALVATEIVCRRTRH